MFIIGMLINRKPNHMCILIKLFAKYCVQICTKLKYREKKFTIMSDDN